MFSALKISFVTLKLSRFYIMCIFASCTTYKSLNLDTLWIIQNQLKITQITLKIIFLTLFFGKYKVFQKLKKRTLKRIQNRILKVNNSLLE